MSEGPWVNLEEFGLDQVLMVHCDVLINVLGLSKIMFANSSQYSQGTDISNVKEA